MDDDGDELIRVSLSSLRDGIGHVQEERQRIQDWAKAYIGDEGRILVWFAAFTAVPSGGSRARDTDTASLSSRHTCTMPRGRGMPTSGVHHAAFYCIYPGQVKQSAPRQSPIIRSRT